MLIVWFHCRTCQFEPQVCFLLLCCNLWFYGGSGCLVFWKYPFSALRSLLPCDHVEILLHNVHALKQFFNVLRLLRSLYLHLEVWLLAIFFFLLLAPLSVVSTFHEYSKVTKWLWKSIDCRKSLFESLLSLSFKNIVNL